MLFVAGAALLVVFGFVEHRQGDSALVPPDVLANRVFASACLTVLLMSAIFFSALLYLPQFMSKGLGYSALTSGAGLLPLMGTFALTSFAAGPLYNRLGAKPIVSAGAAFLGLGIFLLSFIDSDSDYVSLVPGMIVLGTGVGLFYSSITTAAVTALDLSRSSLAGGIVYMFQIAGGAIGLEHRDRHFRRKSHHRHRHRVPGRRRASSRRLPRRAPVRRRLSDNQRRGGNVNQTSPLPPRPRLMQHPPASFGPGTWARA